MVKTHPKRSHAPKSDGDEEQAPIPLLPFDRVSVVDVHGQDDTQRCQEREKLLDEYEDAPVRVRGAVLFFGCLVTRASFQHFSPGEGFRDDEPHEDRVERVDDRGYVEDENELTCQAYYQAAQCGTYSHPGHHEAEL